MVMGLLMKPDRDSMLSAGHFQQSEARCALCKLSLEGVLGWRGGLCRWGLHRMGGALHVHACVPVALVVPWPHTGWHRCSATCSCRMSWE